jgi:hypothetical protein
VEVEEALGEVLEVVVAVALAEEPVVEVLELAEEAGEELVAAVQVG